MQGYIKELKKVEKCKEVNLYLKSLILEYIEKNNFPELYKNSIKEQLSENNASILDQFYTFLEPESKSDPKKVMRVGLLDGDNYAIDQMEHIYGREGFNLHGYLGEKYVVKNEKLSRDIPDTIFVCEGAILKCTSRGSITSLQVMDRRRETLNGAKIATEADKTLAEIGFKKCGKSGCSFSSSDGWQEVSIGSMSNDHMQLLNTSYIMCDKGSKIIIEDPNCVEKGN